ncbi:MAG TPA: DUF3180 domain-containing protein [Mycobacteriales bacterium]|jgi:hypothetical protein|nr:DUF3180 domain-containing protein [Mycobacteriales bacterium]
MSPTRWRDLALAAIVAAAIAYVVTRLDYVNLPSPSVYSLLWIPLLAIAELYIALVTRSRLLGRHGTRPINPLIVARIAALAKATALVGALALGAYAGFFGWVVRVSSTIATRDTRTAAIGAGLSVALIAAASFLEHVCRVPHDPDDNASPDPDGGG